MRSMMLQQSGETRSEILGPAVEPNSYNDFVRLETGVIERLFGHAPFIMWVSRSIDAGESWQAGVLLAHAAYARGRLAMRDKYDGPFGISAWVTGIVSAGDFLLKKVTHLREKLASSVQQFEDARRRGARVIAFFPRENAPEVDQFDRSLRDQLLATVELVPVATAGEMFEYLDLRGSSENSPYRGLFRFEPEDRAFFFGRRDTVNEAIDRLLEGFHDDCPFLLIRGQSGVGKSSLARAGILGNLERLQSYGEWTTAIVDLQDAGGEPPLSALAASLVKALPSLVSSGLDAVALARLDPRLFAAKVAAALPYHTEASIPHRLLLLIDQLERLFPIENAEMRSGKDHGREDARDTFAQTLTALVESKAAWIIATMRRDFLPKIDDCPDLVALARGRDFLLRPPRREELKEIILEPMKLWGFDPRR
jgi:hypothetical protein